jgi:hypothetical protein
VCDGDAEFEGPVLRDTFIDGVMAALRDVGHEAFRRANKAPSSEGVEEQGRTSQDGHTEN